MDKEKRPRKISRIGKINGEPRTTEFIYSVSYSPMHITRELPGSGRKWTVLGQSERFRVVKLEGANDWRSRVKVDGLKD